MARPLTFQAKSLFLFILVLLLWWVLPVVFKQWTKAGFHEFQAPVWTGISHLRDLREYWTLRSQSKSELIEASIDTARLKSAYALQNQTYEALQRELSQLESFFDLPPLSRHRLEIARVVRRDLSGWWQQMVIRKGNLHGIQPGQAVVFSGGVVGKVREVGQYTAKVELISSPGFRVAAHFEGDGRPVEFTGGLNPSLGNPNGIVANVPADIQTRIDDPLRLTSSRLGGVFPDGFTLGYVYSLELSEDGLFQRGKVKLDPRLHGLREVAVLISLEQEKEVGE